MKTPELSIIIPTIDYLGRKTRIDAIVATLSSQNIAESPAEVIVVDNSPNHKNYRENSENSTKIIREPAVGLNYARNAGIKAAAGNIIAFLDDDVIPSKTWLASLIRAHKLSDTLCVGGPVTIEDWNRVVIPKWFSEYFLRFIIPSKFPQLAGRIKEPYYLIGANMSFKKEVFSNYGFFDTNLDRRGGCLLSGGDVEFMIRLKPENIFYEPLAAVSTKITQERLTKRYFIRRLFWQAVSDARIIKKHGLERFYDRPEIFISAGFTSLLFKTLRGKLFFQTLCMMIRIMTFKTASIFNL
ncbi:MAG: glycosyltransferase [Patescibacteria group bacterium]